MPRAFHIMTKPMGAICNLDCSYCFYLEKESLYPDNRTPASFRMSDEVLDRYIHAYIAEQDAPEIWFAWQGGEPTLAGLDYFRRIVELQARHAVPGRRVRNSLQTNGTLLDDAWCEFLAKNDFLVGLSIDGPPDLHDRYRLDRRGRGSFDRVMAGWELLKKHGVVYNTLTVVHRELAGHPMRVYDFLKANGAEVMQFIPLVERAGATDEQFHEPPLLRILNEEAAVTSFSVEPRQYGEFLVRIFDHWVRHDVGRHFVQLFDVQLGIEMGLGSSLCFFAETCGKALAIEHNGDLFSCDHYVYPKYHLGNVMEQSLWEMIDSPRQKCFGDDKRDALPKFCRECDVRKYCNGECPKHRFAVTPDGEPGLNYLCPAYKLLFSHMRPYLQLMAALLKSDRAASDIMEILASRGV